MAQASFKIDDRRLRQKLKTAPQKAKDSILRAWKYFMLGQTQERYRKGVSPDGQRWKSTSYKGKRHTRTLYGRGDLYRSIRGFDIDGNTVAVGSNMVYAGVHQHGAKFTATRKQSAFLFFNVFRPKYGKKALWSNAYKINIPARPFLGINRKDNKVLKNTATERLKRALN